MKRVITASSKYEDSYLEDLMNYHIESLIEKLTKYSREHGQLKTGGFPKGSKFSVMSKRVGGNSYSFELYYVNPNEYDGPKLRFVDSFIMFGDNFKYNDEADTNIIDKKIDKYIDEYYHKYE